MYSVCTNNCCERNRKRQRHKRGQQQTQVLTDRQMQRRDRNRDRHKQHMTTAINQQNVHKVRLTGSAFLKGSPTNLDILPYFVVFELQITKIATKVLCRVSGWQTNALKFSPGRRHLEFLMIDDVNQWSVAEVIHLSICNINIPPSGHTTGI